MLTVLTRTVGSADSSNIVDDNIFKKDKNCYVITKYGSMAHPVICYKRNNDGVINENKVIGGYTELIEFLSDKMDDKLDKFLYESNCSLEELISFLKENYPYIQKWLIKQEEDKVTSNMIKNDSEQPCVKLGLTELSQECMVAANYIIEEVNKYNKDRPLRNQMIMHVKKLQKLLYFSDVEYMKNYDGVPMFRDDFYAWPSGPVIPEIYYRHMQYQDGTIYPKLDGITMTITEEMKSIINKVIEENKELDTLDMMEKSNIAGGPWAQVFDANDKEHNQVISKEEMFRYYKPDKAKIRKRELL